MNNPITIRSLITLITFCSLITPFLLLCFLLASCSTLPQMPTEMKVEKTMDSLEQKRNMSGLQVVGVQLPPLPQPAGEKPATAPALAPGKAADQPGQTTLFEMLGLAGGPTPNAGSEVLVLRPAAKAALNRTKLVREKDGKKIEINKIKLDELIQPEDIIMVPESFF